MGNCILSKSTKNRLALWAPDSNRYTNAPLVLREFITENNDIWFLRFDLSIPLDLLAVGNKYGKVYIYNLSPSTEFKESKLVGQMDGDSADDDDDDASQSDCGEFPAKRYIMDYKSFLCYRTCVLSNVCSNVCAIERVFDRVCYRTCVLSNVCSISVSN